MMCWVAAFSIKAEEASFQDLRYTLDDNYMTAEVAANPKASGDLLVPAGNSATEV